MSEKTPFDAGDRESLRRAVKALEKTGWMIRLASALGVPIEKLIGAVPKKLSAPVRDATRAALMKALKLAVYKLGRNPGSKQTARAYKVAVAATGAAGGFFGVATVAVELLVSTTIMLRSIAAVARDAGENLQSPEARWACLEVFALGGGGKEDDNAETAYYAVRAALAKSVAEAATFIAERGLAEESTPVLVRLVTQIAGRFGVVISEKVAAEALPIIGSLGGASINLLFIDHFQNVARGHFEVRRLERIYGTELVRSEYERLKRELEV